MGLKKHIQNLLRNLFNQADDESDLTSSFRPNNKGCDVSNKDALDSTLQQKVTNPSEDGSSKTLPPTPASVLGKKNLHNQEEDVHYTLPETSFDDDHSSVCSDITFDSGFDEEVSVIDFEASICGSSDYEVCSEHEERAQIKRPAKGLGGRNESYGTKNTFDEKLTEDFPSKPGSVDGLSIKTDETSIKIDEESVKEYNSTSYRISICTTSTSSMLTGFTPFGFVDAIDNKSVRTDVSKKTDSFHSSDLDLSCSTSEDEQTLDGSNSFDKSLRNQFIESDDESLYSLDFESPINSEDAWKPDQNKDKDLKVETVLNSQKCSR